MQGLGELPLWQTLGLWVPDHVLTKGEAEAVAALEIKARRCEQDCQIAVHSRPIANTRSLFPDHSNPDQNGQEVGGPF